MLNKNFYSIIMVFFVMSLLSSCAVTTESTEASSETFENTTEASSDLTSSTSSRDDDKTSAAKVLKFVKSNFIRLRADMAVGEGEYLSTLASLLSLDNTKKEQFYALTKNNFNQLFVSSETTAEELVAQIHRELAQVQI
jgi:ABC-type enterochelin transport system substrate-binding protein